jgi:PD-(D/E)XK nuclease superfamily protein
VVDLTGVQRRTLGVLTRAGASVPPGYGEHLRERLEDRLAEIELPDQLWLSKARLNERARCEGAFAADLAGEREAFTHGRETAVGSIVHRAVQADVAGERAADPRTIVQYALAKLLSDSSLPGYWMSLVELERGELLAEATRQLVMFREMFPPLDRHWQPLSELPLKVRLLEGRIILLGRPDLVLGRPPSFVIDLKTGDPRAEHAEDARYYALLMTLMFAGPPRRMATAYLDSLELQPEEVGESTLERAADRVVEAVGSAAGLLGDGAPQLTPGPYCSWCPRASVCPQSSART